MDKHEAKKLLMPHLDAYRERPWDELRLRIGESDRCEVTGESGTIYQVQIQFFWDSKPEDDIRIMGAIDDGGWRALVPVTESFIMRRDGSFIGEGDEDLRMVAEVGGRPYHIVPPTRVPVVLGVIAVVLALFLHPIYWFAIPVVLLAAATATPHFNLFNGCLTWCVIIGALIASTRHPDVGIPLAIWAFIAWFLACIETRIKMQPHLLPDDLQQEGLSPITPQREDRPPQGPPPE